MNIFRKKDIASVKEAIQSNNLQKTLTSVDLILFGLGAIIGTGVFVLTGFVAAEHAGPAVFLSYIISGVTCIFVALSYTELANIIPTSGTVYSYSYVALGEVFAWLVAGALVLELSFSAATVAIGWSAYMKGLLQSMNLSLPECLSNGYFEGGCINILAVCIIMLGISVLYFGTTESKKVNAILVAIKMSVIVLFIVFALPHFNIDHFKNFMPNGFNGVLEGAGILFFAFGGFATLTATAEECKNPNRDLTIGIIASLILATSVYVIVSLGLIGILPYTKLDSPRIIALALEGGNNNIVANIISIGITLGMPSVIMMNIYAQSRIFYTMSRDGLIPRSLSLLHKKYNSPHVMLLILGSFTALLAAFCPYKILGQLTSMGGLIDYITVAFIVLLMRIKYPNLDRPFKCPMLFVIAPIALLLSGYLLYNQIIKNGQLLDVGYILIGWFVMLFILYILRVLFIAKKQGRKLC